MPLHIIRDATIRWRMSVDTYARWLLYAPVHVKRVGYAGLLVGVARVTTRIITGVKDEDISEMIGNEYWRRWRSLRDGAGHTVIPISLLVAIATLSRGGATLVYGMKR